LTKSFAHFLEKPPFWRIKTSNLKFPVRIIGRVASKLHWMLIMFHQVAIYLISYINQKSHYFMPWAKVSFLNDSDQSPPRAFSCFPSNFCVHKPLVGRSLKARLRDDPRRHTTSICRLTLVTYTQTHSSAPQTVAASLGFHCYRRTYWNYNCF
jgi:hypothetical protein